MRSGHDRYHLEHISSKKEFDHGASVYYLKKGIKISKFLKSDNTLAYWYCDIVDYEYGKNTLPDCQPPEPASKAQQGHDCLTCIDLLADIVIYPDGFVKVVDLDELAEAAEQASSMKRHFTACFCASTIC